MIVNSILPRQKYFHVHQIYGNIAQNYSSFFFRWIMPQKIYVRINDDILTGFKYTI